MKNLSSRIAFLAIALSFGHATAAEAPPPAPKEVYKATATVTTAKDTTRTAPVAISIHRYTSDAERQSLAKPLESGATAELKKLLGAMPEAATIRIGEKEASAKYAYARAMPSGRIVTLVFDRPLFFLGADATLDKEKKGYEFATVILQLDAKGNGDGELAGAAKLKPGPEGGVVIDDYSVNLIRLEGVAPKTP